MEMNIPDKLWQGANTVTAFAVLQGIAYLYVTPNAGMQSAILESKWMVIILIILCHCLYVYAVIWCHQEFIKFADASTCGETARRVSNCVKQAQIFIIISFALFTLVITIKNTSAGS